MTRAVAGGVFFFFFARRRRETRRVPTPNVPPGPPPCTVERPTLACPSPPPHGIARTMDALTASPRAGPDRRPPPIDRALGWATPGASRRAPAVRRPDEEDTMERVKDKECEAREKAMVSGDVEGSV